MATPPAQTPTPLPVAPAPPTRPFPMKAALIVVAALALGVAGWAIWTRVNDARSEDDWDDLYKVMRDGGDDLDSWFIPAQPGDLAFARDRVRSYEAVLAKHESNPALAAH